MSFAGHRHVSYCGLCGAEVEPIAERVRVQFFREFLEASSRGTNIANFHKGCWDVLQQAVARMARKAV